MNELKHVKHPEHCLARSEHVSVSLMERNERGGNTQKEQGICHTGGREGSSWKVTSWWGANRSRG